MTYVLWEKPLKKGEWCIWKVFFTLAILCSTIREWSYNNNDQTDNDNNFHYRSKLRLSSMLWMLLTTITTTTMIITIITTTMIRMKMITLLWLLLQIPIQDGHIKAISTQFCMISLETHMAQGNNNNGTLYVRESNCSYRNVTETSKSFNFGQNYTMSRFIYTFSITSNISGVISK